MRTNWIARRVHSRLVLRPALSTCWAGRCCRRASSDVIVRCSCPVASLVVSRLALLASCLSCGLSSGVSVVSACYPFRSFRPIVVSLGSPLVRQGRRGECGLRVGLCSTRSLLPVACRGLAVDVAVAVFSLVGLARCRRVDGVGCLRDFRCPRCLPWAFLSVWCVSLVPVACFAPRCRRGSSWADCHRVLSSWLRLVVVGERCRRRLVLLVLGCRRHQC